MRALALLTLLLVAISAHAELPSASAVQVREALASGKPTLIDLGARSCIPCKKMAPVLEGLATAYQGQANILFIDVRTDAEAARSFGIQMIPTQIFFDATGKEHARHIGEMDKAALMRGLAAAGLQ